MKRIFEYFYPVLKFIKKELIQTFSDKRMLPLLFIAPITQLLIFGYAVKLDIKDLSVGVFNQENSPTSRELIRRITSNEFFRYEHEIYNNERIETLLNENKVDIVIVIPPKFEKNLIKNGNTDFQILLNGINSNSAAMAKAYLEAIVLNYNQDLFNKNLFKSGNHLLFKNLPQIIPETRMLYNQELKSSNFMVPGIIAMLLFMLTILLTTLSISREREMGTFELLIVSPIKPMQLVLGKTIPFALIGLLDVTLILAAGKIIFNLPIQGSLIMIYLTSIAFIFLSLGFGLFISSISKTQSQSILTMVFILQPSIILSGFMFPIENMPQVLQYLAYANPLTYYVALMRSLLLKGVVLWNYLGILVVYSFVVFSLSAYQFRKNLD